MIAVNGRNNESNKFDVFESKTEVRQVLKTEIQQQYYQKVRVKKSILQAENVMAINIINYQPDALNISIGD